MTEIMTKEESYADRRQLFKNIWETAMQIDEKDVDNIMAKPKVIKTLRLDEVDKCTISKRKKERIRNLRTVCKKILDFCDRQDADDLYYAQKTDRKETEDVKGEEQPQHKFLKKAKKYHRKKKVKRAKSLFLPKQSSGIGPTKPLRKTDYPRNSTDRNNSHIKTNRPVTTNLVQRTSITKNKIIEAKSSTDTEEESTSTPAKRSITRRKVVRKKRSKQKKSNASPPGPSGASPIKHNLSPPRVTGHLIVKHIRQILTDNVIEVT